MTAPSYRVLFLCVHNSARSQMAEAFLNQLSDGQVTAESAGIEPGTLNPLAVQVMAEVGIDISGAAVKNVPDLVRRGRRYGAVITLCGEGETQCPIFPFPAVHLHWPFPDPSAPGGSDEERLERARLVRDAIRERIAKWLAEPTEGK